MTVLIDTGVFYAQADEAANRHDVAKRALSTCFQGKYGQPYTSDYVYDEAVTLTHSRTGDHERTVTVGERIRGAGHFPELVKLVRVTRDVFQMAVSVFERYDDQRLSFTDATTVTLVERHDLDHVLSFDGDFDGIVDRLDPREVQ